MGQKHFISTHTFCSEQTRRLFLTPPENLNPPTQRLNEKEWSKASKGSYATVFKLGSEMMISFFAIGLQMMKNRYINR